MLRDYQAEAVELCTKARRLAIQAPTGSGKSWIIAEYIKREREKDPSATIVLSTGFNNLVFDLHETLLEFGVKNRVLMGRNALVCCKSGVIPSDPDNPFTDDPKLRPTNFGCLKCDEDRVQYRPTVFAGEVLVTNHSMLSIIQDRIQIIKGAQIIIDEAHTLYGYVSSYNEVELVAKDFKDLQLELLRSGNSSSKIKLIIDKIKIHGINPDIVLATHKLYPGVSEKISRADNLLHQPRNSIWIESDKTKFRVRRFVAEKFIPMVKTLFFTATLSSFDKAYLGLNDRNIHKIDVMKANDSFIIPFKTSVEAPAVGYIKDVVTEHKDDRGLLLSTSTKEINNYIAGLPKTAKLYKDIASFKGAGLLYGSRKFFQGVNIFDLDYIIITKLPFPVYHAEYQKWSAYVEKFMNISSWDISFSQMQTDLIQAVGRLRRRPDQEGDVYIGVFGKNYDSRAVSAVAEFFNMKVRTK